MSDSRVEPWLHTLLISKGLWEEMERHMPTDGLEHGGKALGRIFTDGTAVACVHVGAGPLARRTATSFSPDIVYQQGCLEGLTRRFPRLRLTLDYHLHPGGPSGLSLMDRAAIEQVLSPGGWGLEQLLFLVICRRGHSPERPALHAYHARRSTSGAQVREVGVQIVSDDDERVRSLLTSPPPTVRVVVPAELLSQVERELSQGAPAVDLYGYQRLSEGLVQVLGRRPSLDLYRVGRAFPPGEAPALAEGELRLTLAGGGAQGALRVGGEVVPAQVEGVAVSGQLHARNAGLVPAGLAGRRVALIGLGSVGSAMGLLLAQAGVGAFVLLDPDHLSPPNLSRHVGDLRDLGRRKDTLMVERLLLRNPSLEVSAHPLDVKDPAHTLALERLVGEVDLLVVSTDDPTANLAANRLATELGVPCLFVGVFEGGQGGEVFSLRPGQSGCYNCVAGFRAQLPPPPRSERAHDYLSLRPGQELPPLHALGMDITHVVSIAARRALAMLEDVQASGPPLWFVGGAQPGWIFERPFEVVTAELDAPGCPVCRPHLLAREGDSELLDEGPEDDGYTPAVPHLRSEGALDLPEPEEEPLDPTDEGVEVTSSHIQPDLSEDKLLVESPWPPPGRPPGSDVPPPPCPARWLGRD